jgi:aspartate aminotransferase-like enzyme
VYKDDVASSDIEDDFFELYAKAQSKVKRLLNARNADVAIFSGEAMVALWGGMKSILRPKDKVLAVSTGMWI